MMSKPWDKALPHPNSYTKEGYDHINLIDSSESLLGRSLALRSINPISHPILGNFLAIDGLWGFVGTKNHDDRCRRLWGNRLRTFISRQEKRPYVPNLKALIIDAYDLYLQSHQHILDELLDNELPIDCYLTRSRNGKPLRERPPYAAWLLYGLNHIKLAIIHHEAPDLQLFMDNTSLDLYDINILLGEN